jgi:hypothetical protein
MTANVYFGNGSQLTGVTAATAGTVTTASQPNITSTGTLTSLAVTGNISAGNMSATLFTGALTGLASSATVAASANSVALANVVGVGNIASINKDGNASNILYGNGVFAPTPTMYANSNVATFLASYGSNTITTTGNVNVGNIIGNGQALTGLAGANVSGAVTYATTANSVAGANVSGQVGNALVAGTVYANAQTNITSVGTLTSLSVSGNITGANIIATNYNIRSVGTGISAAGSSQGTGTALTKEINIVSTVASGANGVVLPTAVRVTFPFDVAMFTLLLPLLILEITLIPPTATQSKLPVPSVLST